MISSGIIEAPSKSLHHLLVGRSWYAPRKLWRLYVPVLQTMSQLRKHTLLIVDDSPESVSILRQLLHPYYRLKVARSGPAAIQLARSFSNIDLILLDVAMPEMDGYQVSEQLKADPITGDIPIIFVSALDETMDKVRAFEAGGVDYITKPFDPPEVLERVRTHLALLDLNRNLKAEINRRKQAEAALQQANEMLEKRVALRTAELAEANARLEQEIEERVKIAQENERLLVQVRNLARYQQALVEDERARIAQELHDEFGQNLTALKMEVAWLSRHLAQDSPQLLSRLESMSRLLDDTINLVRRVAHELRPRVLDELGLGAALEWLGQEFSNRTGVPCKLCLNDSLASFGRELDTTLFRICQEALTNIARHAQASQVVIRLKKREDVLILSIEDNGIGIRPEQVNSPRSFGLLGMRERVRLWQGELSISGAPGQGTKVQVVIPLKEISISHQQGQ